MTILFTKQPLVLNVELAELIGLNEAIVLQQVHYWLENKKNSTKEKDLPNERTYQEGRFWTYNTYKEWQEQFPFWSVRTVERNFRKLEKMKLLKSGNFNKMKADQTKWYTINYDVLEALENEAKESENVDTEQSDNVADCVVEQSDNVADSNPTMWQTQSDNVCKPIPEITSKISLRVLEEEELLTLADVIAFADNKILEREITNQKTLKAISEAITKCKAIGTSNRESMENFVIKVVEEKMSLLGQKQRVTSKTSKQPKKVREEMIPDWTESKTIEQLSKSTIETIKTKYQRYNKSVESIATSMDLSVETVRHYLM